MGSAAHSAALLGSVLVRFGFDGDRGGWPRGCAPRRAARANGPKHGLVRTVCGNFLHLDIMDRGITIIGDGGTYSYNKGDKWLNYFSGIGAHNTIQFNDSEPMPRISRFLFSEWPSGRLISFVSKKSLISASAKYSDYLGRSHERKVSIENRTWTITDNISCFSGFAVLRWRLCKANWKIEANQLISDKAIINIKVNKASTDSINLVKGYQSDFYNELSKIDVFEIILNKPCMIETTIKLKVAVT